MWDTDHNGLRDMVLSFRAFGMKILDLLKFLLFLGGREFGMTSSDVCCVAIPLLSVSECCQIIGIFMWFVTRSEAIADEFWLAYIKCM